VLALLVALTLGYIPRANAAEDAPLAVPATLPVAASALTPAEQERIQIGKVIAGLKDENTDLKASAAKQLPPIAVVGIAVGAFLLGGLAGYGILKGVESLKTPPTP
jgi:hypothetical protein